MKKPAFIIYLILLFHFVSAQTKGPHLQKQGTAVRLIVNNQPYLVLAGQLHNSSASDAAYLKPVWKQLAARHLNTVIAPVSWELIEDQKGRFDFSLPDSMIMGARKQGLHLILLWFGSWKSGASTYVPSWVKKNFHQYPYVKDQSGKTLEILSAFGEATWVDEANAFARLMTHIKQIDQKQQTVIMMQVENEAGILHSNRDYSADANSAFNSAVPADLFKYFIEQKKSLVPELLKLWQDNGFKTEGTWEQVFGKSTFDKSNWQHLSYYTEELFTAYYHARYIGIIAAAGKAAYPIPMYVNAWLKHPGEAYPGSYPSGGPLPQVIDMYRCAAPAIDLIAPDIYTTQFKKVADQFNKYGNPLFIPETLGGTAGAATAFYAFGEHNAIGFSPFGIDGDAKADKSIDKAYAVLNQLKELIFKNEGLQTMKGILVDTAATEQHFNLAGYRITARLSDKNACKIAGGIIINVAPDEFIVAGKSLDVLFEPELAGNLPLIAIDVADEGVFKKGKWVKGKRLNGDEVNNSMFAGTGLKFPSANYSIQYVRFYRYE